GDGSSKNYKILSEMLQDFDRMDVEQLFRLVKERYSSSAPEGFDLMLWGDLHTLFEPDENDEIWKDQHEYNLLSWRLHDFCGIHILLMNNGLAIHMLTEKKYPLSQEMLSKMLSTRLEVDHESSQAFELLRFIRAQGRIVGNKSSYDLILPTVLKGLVLPAQVKADDMKIRRETPKVLLLAWEKFFKIKHACGKKQDQPEDIQDLLHKLLNDVKIISEELADYINTPNWNCPAFYEDDDEEYTIAMTPILPTEEPDNSLSMGNKHLSTIPKTESDGLIKSSVENLVPIPSESEDFSDIESECDVPVCDDFTTFSNLLFDADDDFSSSDDESFSDEDVPKEIYSNPLFDKEIISTKIDPHHFNAESNVIESLLNPVVRFFVRMELSYFFNEVFDLGSVQVQEMVQQVQNWKHVYQDYKKDWFKDSPKPKVLDFEWNTIKTIDDTHEQRWFNKMVHVVKPPLTSDELMITPIDFRHLL
ncbi:hypothetical protein Tco_0613461, partial [Tanacetum coccineum]